MIFLDTSAAVKALIDEAESAAVISLFADGTEFVASRLLAVELHAVADRRSLSHEQTDDLLSHISLVSLDDDIMTRAIGLHSGLRALDALHLATAIRLRDTITSVLTYDQELADAARQSGIAVTSPR
ncbi:MULTISPECIES: type II toxin-antitoxin system VapC family toxin [unclassified Microbacterium]|uniref:type II toxin-antitoxin system VapC family toxin n=1 Tax=unclassified Microbacterium TaxID=2609290 RepID=UPI003019A2DE